MAPIFVPVNRRSPAESFVSLGSLRLRTLCPNHASYVRFAFFKQRARQVTEHQGNFGFAPGKRLGGDSHRGCARNEAMLLDVLCAKAIEA
jgi:hypothetical protein